MNNTIQYKLTHLLEKTRVMTVSVLQKDHPWSAPVYFVFQQGKFYFFSNPASEHIRHTGPKTVCSAVVFEDADAMDHIFGLQMTGTVVPVSGSKMTTSIVSGYLQKFDFLVQAFGSRILKNPSFFLEKFNSRLYGFFPEKIWFSENAGTGRKQIKTDLMTYLKNV